MHHHHHLAEFVWFWYDTHIILCAAFWIYIFDHNGVPGSVSESTEMIIGYAHRQPCLDQCEGRHHQGNNRIRLGSHVTTIFAWFGIKFFISGYCWPTIVWNYACDWYHHHWMQCYRNVFLSLFNAFYFLFRFGGSIIISSSSSSYYIT